MKKGILATFALLLLASAPATGWEYFNDGNFGFCAECHADFMWLGPLHDQHGQFTTDCQTCHVEIGDFPATNNCAACHGFADLVNRHMDGMISLCAMCHSELPRTERDWSEIKSLYQD